MSNTAIDETRPRTRSALLLPVLCVAQFMVILDVSIVNIAVPTIGKALKVSESNLQWVVIGYGLTLGGFLLLGGRCADLLGRRRMFTIGVSVFTLASLGCGLSRSLGLLIACRVIQGLGAAFTAPSALSILTTAFEEGPERNKALGVWGALGGVGSIAGVLLGGIITEALGWRWIFIINVPVGALLVLAAGRVLPESHGDMTHRGFDIPGAATVTSGLMLGVYAINRSIEHGWSDSITLACVVASVVLLISFLIIESQTRAPLMHLALFKVRSVSVANILALVGFGAVFANFFLLSLYMQQVLGYSALKTGFAYLPLGVIVSLAAAAASMLVTRLGPRPIAVTGMACNVLAFFLLSRAPVDASYLTNLLPAFILGAIALGFSAVSVQIAAFSGVREDEAGLAAGLINTAQEIGGAIMVAVAATIAISATRSYIVARGGDPSLGGIAFTHGVHQAFIVLAIMSGAAALVALFGLQSFTPPPPPTAHQTVRPLAPKAIHEHATDRQREHVARHGHVGARTAPEFVSAPAGQWAPTRPPNASTRAKKAAVKKATAKRTAAKQAPATRAATKKAVAKKAVAKKSAIKKVAAPKKSAAAKKATKRPRG